MCCAVVTRDDYYPRRRQAHPTAHAASQAGIHRHEIPRTADQWRRRSSPSPPGRNSRRNTAAAVSRQQSGFSVLPPISSDGQRLEDNNFKLSELDDITLKNQCLRRLREMSERALQSLLAHLRAQDRDRDGVLSKGQTMVALEKYQLGLSEDATTNLCRKFGDTFDGAVVVRYEPLLSFLITMRMQALKAPPPPPQPPQPPPQSPPPPPQPPPPPHYALTQDDSSYSYVESIPMGYEEEEEEGEREEDEDDEEERRNEEEEEEQDVVIQPRPRLISLRNKVLFGDRDEAKLIIDLERQLADKPVTLSDLRVTLYELDHDRNDFVSGEQVETALKRCGVHLTPDVRARLLMATDPTGAGFYGIETLMSYIERVKPEAHCIMRGDPGPLRQARTGPLPGFQNQPRLQPPWPHSRPLQARSQFLTDEGFSEDHSEEGSLGGGGGGRSRGPAQQSLEGDAVAEFDLQRWRSDYKYLAHALYQADDQMTGYLPEAEVAQIAATYSLVYQLLVSPSTMNSALRQAYDSTFGEVNLDHFLAVLPRLHLRNIK